MIDSRLNSKLTAAKAPKKEGGLSQAVKLVVKTFLNQKHYQDLHQLLAEEWSHLHSLTAAVRLMEAHGVYISQQEEKKLAQLKDDSFIDVLVSKMPGQSREQFEHFFLQLSLIASTTTRLRAALETGNSAGVDEVLDSAENVGILQFILKMAVAQAGQEVKSHMGDHKGFMGKSADTMRPLLQAQAEATRLGTTLEQAKHELGLSRVEANEKSKRVLMSLSSGNAETLRHAAFNEWATLVKQIKRENEIRTEYEEEIEQAEKKLQDYILKQTAIMRNVINKKHNNTKEGLLHSCIAAFQMEVEEAKDRAQKALELKDLEAKMSQFSADQNAKSKKVLGRLNAGSDLGLMQLHFTAWTQFAEEYKKNREFEDAVKAEEKKIAEFMKKQNEGAKSVLNRMSSATESGLVQACFAGWKEEFETQKKALEYEDMINSGSGRFSSFSKRNKASAGGAMDRAAEAAELATTIIMFAYWKRETKVTRMKQYAKEKNHKKKQQLVGVKGLFRNFANELETGLKDGTPRVDISKIKEKRSSRNPSPSPKPAAPPAAPA